MFNIGLHNVGVEKKSGVNIHERFTKSFFVYDLER